MASKFSMKNNVRYDIYVNTRRSTHGVRSSKRWTRWIICMLPWDHTCISNQQKIKWSESNGAIRTYTLVTRAGSWDDLRSGMVLKDLSHWWATTESRIIAIVIDFFIFSSSTSFVNPSAVPPTCWTRSGHGRLRASFNVSETDDCLPCQRRTDTGTRPTKYRTASTAHVSLSTDLLLGYFISCCSAPVGVDQSRIFRTLPPATFRGLNSYYAGKAGRATRIQL